jgi:hypothetical protein
VGGAALMVTLATCASESTGGGNESISDPAVFESEMRSNFVPMVEGLADGLERLLIASSGGPADGVVIIPNATGADATISVDLDGNASRESSINGSLSGDIGTGAAVTIADVATAEPSLSGGGSLVATETAPGMVLLDNMAGSGTADPDGSMNAADVAVTDGSVALDVVAGVPDGFLDFTVTGEGNTLEIHVTFEPDGAGGYVLHFTGSGIDFTIP